MTTGRRTDEVPPQTVDDELAIVARQLLPDATSIEVGAGRSHLVRVETPRGPWAVRRWPASTPRVRVDFVHAMLRETREAGFELVPEVASGVDGATTIARGGSFYDAQSWLPGRSPVRGPDLVDERGRGINRPAPLAATTLTSSVRAVASWHRATEAMAGRADLPRAPLEAVLRAVRSTWEEQRQQLRPLAPRTPHIQRWFRSGEVVLAGAVESLAATDFLRDRPPVIGHLDLWPAHILLSRSEGQEQMTGLIDFGAAASTSPLVDLAQLIAHFNGWTGVAAEEAIGAYVDVRPLAPEERRLLPAVAGLDLVVETGRLLTLGYATRAIIESGGVDTIRSGASLLLLSLEAVAPAVHRGDRPEPSRARKWDYGPRRGGLGPHRGGGPAGGRRAGKPRNSPSKTKNPDR